MRSSRFIRGNLHGSATALMWAKKELPHLWTAVKFVSGRGHVVQAGGNLGVWPKSLSRMFRKVTTFEPDPANFAILKVNAPEKNIDARCVALGDREGTVSLSRVRRDGKRDSHPGCVHVSGEGDVTVPMTTIDAQQFKAVNLLYLDIEGYELHVLRGAVETLARCRPVVAVEINKHLASYGVTPADIYAFMEAQGYTAGPKLGIDQVFLPGEA